MEVSAPRRWFRFRLSTVLILTAIAAATMAIPFQTWRYIDGSTGDTWTRHYPSPAHIYPAIALSRRSAEEGAVDEDALKAKIRAAFVRVEYPGDWCLRGSNEGDEPYLLEQEFKGKTDWRALDAAFLDQAPDGFASALSFFSDEAFRFYLPAYLIADVDGRLQSARPTFHLTYGLTDKARAEKVNPRRYGDRTWFQESSHRLSVFDKSQAAAIVAYLEFKREADGFERESIDQALHNFWRPLAAGADLKPASRPDASSDEERQLLEWSGSFCQFNWRRLLYWALLALLIILFPLAIWLTRR